MNLVQTTDPEISSFEVVLVGRNGRRHHDVTITYILKTTGRGGK